MKKILSLVLVLAMLFSIGITAIPVMAASSKLPDFPMNIRVFVDDDADEIAAVAGLGNEGFDWLAQSGLDEVDGKYFLSFLVWSQEELDYFTSNGYKIEITHKNSDVSAAPAMLSVLTANSDNSATHYTVDASDGYIVGITGGTTFPVQPRALNWNVMFDPTGVSFNSVYGFPNRKGYRTVEEYYGEMFYLAKTYPDIVKIHYIGNSWYNPIYALEICDAPGVEDGRPEWMDLAAQHSREWPANELVMNTAWWLVTQYDKYLKGDTTVEPGIVEVMEGIRTWCLPMYNPDGTWYDQSNGSSAAGNNRANRRPGPAYVTSYNEVLQDYAYGTSAGVTGRYYDRSSTVNTANYPVDLNRNFSYRWGSGDGSGNPSPGTTGSTTRGPAPLSEPENIALASLVARRMIGSDYSGHTYGGLVIYPWDNKKSLATTPNMSFEDLGRRIWSYNSYNDYHERVIYSQSGEGQGFLFGSWRSLGFTYEMGYNYNGASQINFVPPYFGDTSYWKVAVASWKNKNPHITTRYSQPNGELVAPAGTDVIPLHYKNATAAGNGHITTEITAPVYVMMPECVPNQYNINNCKKDEYGNHTDYCEYHNLFQTTYTTADLCGTPERLNALLEDNKDLVKDKILLCYAAANAANGQAIILAAQAAGAKAVLFAQSGTGNNANSDHVMTDAQLRFNASTDITIPVALMPRPFARDVQVHVQEDGGATLTLKPNNVPWNTQMMEWERNAYSFLELAKFTVEYNGHIKGSVTDGKGKAVDGAKLELSLDVYAPILKPETANNAQGRDIFWWSQSDLTADQKARFGDMLLEYVHPEYGDVINVRKFTHTSYIDQFDADGKFDWSVVPSTQPDTYAYEGLRQPAASSSSTNAIRGFTDGAGFECNTPDDPRIGSYLFPNDGYTTIASKPGHYTDTKKVVVSDYKVTVDNVNYEIPVAITTDFSFTPDMAINKDITVNFKAFNKDGTPYTGKVSALLNNYNISVTGLNSSASEGIVMALASTVEGEYTLTFNLDSMGIGSIDKAVLFLSLDGDDEMAPLVIGENVETVNPDNLTLTSDKPRVVAGEYFNLTAAFDEEVESNAAILTFNFDPDVFVFHGFTASTGVTAIDTVVTNGQAKVTVAVLEGYGINDFGSIMLQAKEGAEFNGALKTFSVNAQYVINSVPKTIANGTAFTTVRTDVIPEVGDFTLIDLSNIIDWFGTTNEDSDWFLKYAAWDFDGNGRIEIFDISFVAKYVK